MSAVYALVSSGEPDIVRYVGRTKPDSPERRLKAHIKDATAGRKYHVHNWIRKVQKAADTVVAITLESDLTWEESGKREIYYIAYYRSLGFDLTNMTSGGDGAPNLPEEVRLVMSAKMRGRGHPQTEETKRKISKAHKGRKPSDEIREKYRQAKLGKRVSDETKAKISKATKGRRPSQKTIEATIYRNKNTHMTDETKDRIRMTLKKHYSEESGRLPGGRKRKINNE